MRIAIDAMGTDAAPAPEIEGALRALSELGDDFEIVLVGDPTSIEAELVRLGASLPPRIQIHPAHDRVRPSDPPATILRKRPDSSIAVGLNLHKAGAVDAFISAGSTGAVMAASLFTLRPLPGVERPSVGTFLPTMKTPTLLLDAGTNVDCKPRHLVQFAHLGRVYMTHVVGVENPRIGLLNIGEEPEKGDETTQEAHRLLAAEPALNFVGNIEGRGIVAGSCDVLVADGFVGNVLLKFYESVAQFILGMVHKEVARAGADLTFDAAMRTLDYSEYGGAPLLGVNGVTIICHGGSSPKAIRNAVRVAVQAVRSDMVADMTAELGNARPPTETG